jgi:hypothetical protein
LLVPGVGSLEPNEGDDGEDEESAVTKDEAWRQLLTNETPPSLKPWSEVSTLKANMTNVGFALREYIRQAWGEVPFYYYFCYLTPIYSENSGRRGKITWGKLARNPQSLIAPRFAVDFKLDNPTRMQGHALTTYWTHWESKAKKGDPFSFLGANGDDRGNDQGDEGMEDLAPCFTIDDGVLPPISCCGTSSNRTWCLQALVTGRSEESKAFRTTVKLVETLEVSYLEYLISTLSHKILE